MNPNMRYPPGFLVRQVEEQAPNLCSQFFGGIQGPPAHPENYRILESSPHVDTGENLNSYKKNPTVEYVL